MCPDMQTLNIETGCALFFLWLYCQTFSIFSLYDNIIRWYFFIFMVQTSGWYRSSHLTSGMNYIFKMMSSLFQRFACWHRDDAQPAWGLRPTAVFTRWARTVLARSWRSILWWGGRLRVWPWTDWTALRADRVISQSQMNDSLNTMRKKL